MSAPPAKKARLSGTPLTPGHAPLPEGVGVDMFSLKGKVALVTGSSKGLGKGMAIGLAQAGAHVLINSRNKSECQAVVEEIKALGCQASEASFDVVDEASVATNVQALAEAHGGIHILVNNAGGTRRSPFLESTSEDLDFVINLNLRGPYFMARECGKVMKKLGGGKIINIGSLMCVLGRKTIQPYNATKFAINGLTRGLACELGPHNIQVNGIGPGYFVTELTQVLLERENFNKMVMTRTPLGYWGIPEDLQGACIFLASGASNYVSGHMLMVDGGMSTSMCDSLIN